MHVGGRFVATDPTDGGASFTQAQLDELKQRGYTTVPVAEKAPAPKVEAPNAAAQLTIAENQAAAKEQAAKANKAPTKQQAVTVSPGGGDKK